MHKTYILICNMSRKIHDVQNKTWKAVHYLISSAFPPELCIIPPRQSNVRTEKDSSPFRCQFFKLDIHLKQLISKWLRLRFTCYMCSVSVHVSVYHAKDRFPLRRSDYVMISLVSHVVYVIGNQRQQKLKIHVNPVWCILEKGESKAVAKSEEKCACAWSWCNALMPGKWMWRYHKWDNSSAKERHKC